MWRLLAALAIAGCVPGPPPVEGRTREEPRPPTAEESHERREVFEYRAPRLDALFLGQWGGYMVPPGARQFVQLLGARGVDYHVGVTDIDYDPKGPERFGVFRRADGDGWISSSEPDAGDQIAAALDHLSHVGISDERGLMAALEAIALSAPGGPNHGFLREDSELLVFVFCFIDDQSTEMAGLTQHQFVDAITAIRPYPQKLGFHSLAINIAGVHPYQQVIDALGGLHWLFPGYEHDAMFAALAHTTKPTNVFQLSTVPLEDTLQVTVRPPEGAPVELTTSEVIYDAATLTVGLDDYHPQDGSLVEIRYEAL